MANERLMGWNGDHFFRLVTLKIVGQTGGNTGTQFVFPDQGDIRYARILALETFFANDLAYAQPENVPVLPDNYANRCSLVFEANDPDKMDAGNDGHGRYSNTSQTVRWYPLTALHRVQTQNGASSAGFVRQLLPWYNLNITWDKSFLVVQPGGLGNTSDVAVVLGVHYTFRDIDGQLRKRS